MITKVWKNEMPQISGDIAYYVLLQDGHRRYLKIGTSTRGTKRFKDRDYRRYSKITPILIFEMSETNEIYDFEDLNKVYLRNQKGLRWIQNDRFTFFNLPNELPIFTNEERDIFIEINT